MLNVAIIMGRITADPELKQTPNGVYVTSFTVAVNRDYVKQGEERQADFINVTAWRNTAEFITKYFKKGSSIVVKGAIQTRNYTDNQGNKRTFFEIVASDVYFGESKGTGSQNQGQPMSGSFGAPTEYSAQPPAFSSGSSDDFEIIDDGEDSDLPF